MPTRRTKLFPTPANFQRANDEAWPLRWAVEYLTALLQKIPETERASAVIGPMGGPNGVEVWFDHELS